MTIAYIDWLKIDPQQSPTQPTLPSLFNLNFNWGTFLFIIFFTSLTCILSKKHSLSIAWHLNICRKIHTLCISKVKIYKTLHTTAINISQ